MFNRRCGFLSFTVLAILAFLVCAPVALAQAVTMVQSSARSAGSSASGFNGDFGPATTVNLSNPSYMVFDSNGNQFVSDTLNNCVRKIDTAGNITTVAGLAISGQSDTCNTSLDATPPPTRRKVSTNQPAWRSTAPIASTSRTAATIASAPWSAATPALRTWSLSRAPAAQYPPHPSRPRLTVWPIDATNNLYISMQDSTSAIPVNQVVQHAPVTAATNVCLVAGAASANVSTQCAGVTSWHLSRSPFRPRHERQRRPLHRRHGQQLRPQGWRRRVGFGYPVHRSRPVPQRRIRQLRHRRTQPLRSGRLSHAVALHLRIQPGQRRQLRPRQHAA